MPSSYELEDVITTHALTNRSKRRPDFALESDTLRRLSDELTSHPGEILQRLVDAVVECCRADSAAVSILEPGPSQDPQGRIANWQATAGMLSGQIDGSVPATSSPSAVVIDRDDLVLFTDPARYFPILSDLEPQIVEALAVPFHVDGAPVGAVWAVLQTDERQFDAEDARLLTSLSRFAAAGYQLATSLRAAETDREALEARVQQRTRELERAVEELRRENRQRERAEAHQKHLATQLRDLAKEMTAVEDRERKQFAALLHDNLQQLLAAAVMKLRRLERSEGAAKDLATDAATLIRQADSASRDLTEQLRPPILYEDGLLPALRPLAAYQEEHFGLAVAIDGDEHDPVELDDDSKAFLFGSVRELLTNVVMHAEVDHACVCTRFEAGGRLSLVVEDEGRGFDSTAPGVHKNPQGFGLFSIQERVAAMGGSMTVDSAEHRGTRVEIDFPVAETAGEEAGAQPAAAHASGSQPARRGDTPIPLRVLIVDDHTLVREGITSMLANDPRLAVIGEAQDGVSAIEATEHLDPDVVVIDVNMPRMGGVQATRQIHTRWPQIKIVGLSVQEDQAIVDAMRAAGAVDLIPKTRDLGAMTAAITQHVPKMSRVSDHVED